MIADIKHGLVRAIGKTPEQVAAFLSAYRESESSDLREILVSMFIGTEALFVGYAKLSDVEGREEFIVVNSDGERIGKPEAGDVLLTLEQLHQLEMLHL
jgi:hypothetical protein